MNNDRFIVPRIRMKEKKVKIKAVECQERLSISLLLSVKYINTNPNSCQGLLIVLNYEQLFDKEPFDGLRTYGRK